MQIDAKTAFQASQTNKQKNIVKQIEYLKENANRAIRNAISEGKLQVIVPRYNPIELYDASMTELITLGYKIDFMKKNIRISWAHCGNKF